MKKILFILGFIAFSCVSYAGTGTINPVKGKENSNLIIKKNIATISEGISNMSIISIKINKDIWICCGSVQLANGTVLTNCVGAATREIGDNFILDWMVQFE